MTKRLSIALIVAACSHSLTRCVTASEFIPLGDFPEGVFFSIAEAISGDGTTVVGAGSRYASSLSASDAMLWTQSAGIVNLQTLPLRESPRTIGVAVSANGATVAGSKEFYYASPVSEAFRWSTAEGIVGLGYLPGAPPTHSAAGDVSGDGAVIVGESSSPNGLFEAFRWTQQTGMVGLGDLPGGDFYSSATGISSDGKVIAGVTDSQFGSEPFRWTAETGMVGLGDLPGSIFGSAANAISSDGTTVVGSGYSEASGFSAEAFRWTASHGMEPLGDLPGGNFSSSAYGVSADGKVVLGISDRDDGFAAFVWDELHGMRDLREVLIGEFGLGTQLGGWRLTNANAISDDGLSVIGTGVNPAGNTEAWLVRLDHGLNVPEPTGILLAALVALRWCVVRRRS